MDTLKALVTRRSIRQFTDKVISKSDLNKLIDAARFAPTARNEQPWEFVAVTDKDRLRQIADIAGNNGPFIAQGTACIIVFCAGTKYYLEDGCSATNYILLAAWSLGIGSCWVAGDKKPYCQEIKGLLKAPDDYRLISIIALGYPKQAPNISKKSAGELTHWEEF